MAVDLERAWYQLKAALPEKRSWGTPQLAELLNKIEVDCFTPDADPVLPGEMLASQLPPGRNDEEQDEDTTDKPATTAAAV